MAKGLTKKAQAFVEAYLTTFNASEAARRAGYSERSAGAIGHELLKKPEIRAAVDARLDEMKMSADEVLTRLAEQARASLGDFVEISASGKPNIKFTSEKMHLIKKIAIRPTKFGTEYEFEMYDAQQALVHLGRNRQIFTDKTDITSGGGQLNFNILPAPPVSDSDVTPNSSSELPEGN